MSNRSADEKLLRAAHDIGTNNLSVGGVPKMQSYFMGLVQTALDDGADVHATDEQGKDAMDWLSLMGNSPTGVCVAAAKLLIDRGYMILDREPIQAMEGSLLDKVMEHLARKERDKKIIRSQSGQNLLHVMAEYPRNALLVSIAAHTILQWGHDNSLSKWVNETDHDGRTPLHVMWQSRTESFEDEDQHWAWDVTMMLEKNGADLTLRDHSGRCVLDLIERMVQQGYVDTDGPLIEKTSVAYFAQIEARLMERSTQPAFATGRTPRL